MASLQGSTAALDVSYTVSIKEGIPVELTTALTWGSLQTFHKGFF